MKMMTTVLPNVQFRPYFLSVCIVSSTSWIVPDFLAILITSLRLFRLRPLKTAFAIYNASSSFSIPSCFSRFTAIALNSSSVYSLRKYRSNLSNSGSSISSLLLAVANIHEKRNP
jgi:hypothetical protein